MPYSDHNRQTDEEGCALPRLAGEIDCTIVQLHDPKRHGQTDAGTLLAGREIQTEDFLPQFLWNPWAGVGDADPGRILVGEGFKTKLAALRHGLHRVNYHIEHNLLKQVAIHPNFYTFGLLLHMDEDIARLGLGPGEFHDLPHQILQGDIGQVEFHRTVEIEEGLPPPIKPQDLARDDLHRSEERRVG